MPKKTSPIKPTTAPSKIQTLKLKALSHPFRAILLLCIALVIGLMGYVLIDAKIDEVRLNKRAEIERQQFQTAEAQLARLYDDVTEVIGEPTSHKEDKYCNYSSAKYSQGPLGCYVVHYLSYGNVESVKASSIASSLNATIERFPDVHQFKNASKESSDSIELQSVSFEINGLKCGTQAVHIVDMDAAYKYNHFPFLNVNSLSGELYCGGASIKEHYPLK